MTTIKCLKGENASTFLIQIGMDHTVRALKIIWFDIFFRYEELCEFSITLVEPDELMPLNYVRFHIPREMTKYELYNYLVRSLFPIPI